MKVISVINYKGGVGKTTLTANVGTELAWRGHNVLLIDLDPQSSLTFSLIRPEEWHERYKDRYTIKAWYDAFEDGNELPMQNLIITPQRVNDRLDGNGRVDLLCSHLGLINVDLHLAAHLGGTTLQQSKRKFVEVHGRLAEGLRSLDPDAYDVVLIDCPPNFNIVTKTALVACDGILIPAKPDYLSTLGTTYLARNVNMLIEEYNSYANLPGGEPVDNIDPQMLGVVFLMVQEYDGEPIAAHRQYIAEVGRTEGVHVFSHYIKRNDTLFGDAPKNGVPVVLQGYDSGRYGGVASGLTGVVDDLAGRMGEVEEQMAHDEEERQGRTLPRVVWSNEW
jgi:chromosome partitioning protein